MDALDPTFEGRIMTEEGWLEFKYDGASWIQGNQVWVLELEPDNSPPTGSRDLEETHERPSTEIVGLNGSSAQSRQRPGMHESDGVKSCTPGRLQAKGTVLGNGRAFGRSLKLTAHQRSRREKLLRCDQCGKAFRYLSHIARHQRVHSRQKAAKRTLSTSEVDRPSSSKPTPVALQVENTSTKSSKGLSQNSKVTADQSSHRKRRHFCDQCGKAFRYPSDLTRHQARHSRQKAAKRGHSQSEAESPHLLESTPLALPKENSFAKSSKAFRQKSKATTGQGGRFRKQHFCDQCGKAFRYTYLLARHQHVHSKRSAAKQGRSQSKAFSPSLALQVENALTNSSQVLSQNSKVTADQSSHRERRHFCNQCGKAFRYPSDLTRHQARHSRQKAAKRGHSQSEAESPHLLESTPLALPKENSFAKSSKALRQNSKATTGQGGRFRKQHFCDQCGKAFRYPSDLTRHQARHSRQKAAKQGHSQSEAESPRLQESTPLESTQVENALTNSSQVLSQNSKVTADQSSHRERRHFCNQCGKAFRYPSDLIRHQARHSKQKAAKRGHFQSEAESPGLLESPRLALQTENTFAKSSKALRQNSRATDSPSPAPQGEDAFTNSSQVLRENSRATRSPSTRRRRLHFCDQCGKDFRYSSDLVRHQYTHSRVLASKRFEWLEEEDAPNLSESTAVPLLPTRTPTDCCEPSSHNSKLVTDHLKKTYLCNQCGKSFSWPSSLTRHERTHLRRKKTYRSESPSDIDSPSVPLPKVPRRENALADLIEAISPSPVPATDQSAGTTKPYLCDQCGEGFWWHSELTQHVGAHFQEQPYDCWTCGLQFWHHMQLVEHQQCHKESQGWEEEGERFQNMHSSSGLREHVSGELLQDPPPEKTGEICEPFASPETCECGACDSGVDNSSELLHVNSIWEIGISGQPYLLSLPPACECRSCESNGEGGGCEQATESSLLPVDVTSSTVPPSAVNSCETGTTALAVPVACPRAQNHVASKSEDKTSTASIPVHRAALQPRSGSPDPEWLPYPSRSSRLGKRARSSTQGAEPHSCPTCSKRFSCAEYLKRHLNVHQPGKPYGCSLCGKRFGRRSYLSKHHRKMHSEADSPLLGMANEPSLLPVEVMSSTALTSAVSSCETGITAPAVPVACPRAQGHVASMPEEETSTASIPVDRAARPPRSGSPDPEWLPYLSRSSRLGKRARSSAQGAESHSCPTCSKRFSCAEYLKRHLNVHQPGKPYGCSLCGKRFGRRSYLSKHHRKMHSEADLPLLGMATEPSLLPVEIMSSTASASAVSSCEIGTTMPAVPVACPRAQGHVASMPEEETSTASIPVDRAARPPRSGSPDPEWLPSPSHSPPLGKRARSSAQGVEPYSCPTCSKHFSCATYLKRHLNVHQPKKPYGCSLCGKRFGQRSDLSKHHRKIHSEADSPLPGMAGNPNTEGLPSPSRSSQLEKRARSSAQGAKPLSSPTCSKCFICAEYLKKRLNVHQPGKTYSCPLCGKKFGRCSYLSKHHRKMHSQADSSRPRMAGSPDPEGLPSPSRSSQLEKRASSSAQGGELHSCPMCSECFSCAEYLKKHLNVHRPGKPYSCSLCEKRFSRPSYLSKHHRKMHSEADSSLPGMAGSPDPEGLPSPSRSSPRSSAQGVKPVSCPTCSKRFSCAEYLKKHLNVHRSWKPFSCSLCWKRFGRTAYLSRHHRKMHSKAGSPLSGTPYGCRVCGKKFGRSLHLSKHYRKMHSEADSPLLGMQPLLLSDLLEHILIREGKECSLSQDASGT